MNKSNIDIVVFNGRDSKIHVSIKWEGESIVDYNITTKTIGNFSVAFAICDIKLYNIKDPSIAYIVMLSSMYCIMRDHHAIFDIMANYNVTPNIVYGMMFNGTPFIFSHDDTINAMLNECESICVGDSIDLVERIVEDVIIMKCEGMKSLLDTYIPDNKMLIHNRN